MATGTRGGQALEERADALVDCPFESGARFLTVLPFFFGVCVCGADSAARITLPFAPEEASQLQLQLLEEAVLETAEDLLEDAFAVRRWSHRSIT